MRGSSDELRFRSFWVAGFEAACHINRHGVRLDLVRATQHDAQLDEDYARVRSVGIQTIREAVRWREIDHGRTYDFTTLAASMAAARRHDLEVLWTLFHYGWPDDADIFAPTFVDRFARYAGEVARFLVDQGEPRPVITLVNEISFLSWAAGEVGWIYPHARSMGGRMKRQLIRATIAGMDAVRDVAPAARFLHAEPLVHVIPPRDRPDLAHAAADQRASQFEALDMLAGGMAPELGGHPRYLDLVGVNFYHANEWEYPDNRLRWEDEPRDPRWVPLADLLAEVHTRYSRPLVIAETSHFGDGRARWLREVAAEARTTCDRGIPLLGVCLYPILDRPDWEDATHWHRSGLWDLHQDGDGRLQRVLREEYAVALQEVSRLTGESAAFQQAGR